jgi:hypothetical protein
MPFVDLMPVPLDAPIISMPSDKGGPAQELAADENFLTWFLNQYRTLSQCVRSLIPVQRAAQAAAISPTPIGAGRLSAGLYVLAYYARISQPASVSSALTVALGWTDGGQSCSQAGASMTGNTRATVQSGIVLLRADAPGTLTYSTVYASVGGTPMQYNLDVALFRVANAS